MVTPRFHPYRGGVEAHTWEVARRLAHDPEFEITILTTDLNGTLPRREVLEGFTVRRVPAWPARSDFYISPGIYRLVREASVDLVHLQGYHTFVPPIAMAAAWRAGIPYVVTLHSGGHSSRLRNAIRPLQATLLRPLLAHAQAIIAVSRYEADLFARTLRLPAARFPLIPNGADLPTMPARSAQPNQESGPPIIVSFGRLERYKGHHRLIAALPAVRRAQPGARLLLVGDGPYEKELERAARRHGVAEAVQIRTVPRTEVREVLERAAVVALLSEYESQGIAAYEALALGARLVVNDSSALAELTRFEQVLSVPPDAPPHQIAEVLIQQLDVPRTSGAELALPTWDECAERLKAVYRAALAS